MCRGGGFNGLFFVGGFRRHRSRRCCSYASFVVGLKGLLSSRTWVGASFVTLVSHYFSVRSVGLCHSGRFWLPAWGVRVGGFVVLPEFVTVGSAGFLVGLTGSTELLCGIIGFGLACWLTWCVRESVWFGDPRHGRFALLCVRFQLLC